MIQKKLISASIAAAITASMSAVGAFAAEEPVFPYFNKNDINGSVGIELPEGLNARIDISFDSPEGDSEPYYTITAEGGSLHSFDIEGRTNTDDDYRIYNLTVTLSDSSAAPFTDTFTVPDGNDEPDSFVELKYVFAVDDAVSDNEWDMTEKDGVKTVAYHLDAFMLGDVDGNGRVDSSDASRVLMEYSRLSTTGESTLTETQKKAADVNHDGAVNASDASRILVYYSVASTTGNPTWD